MDKQTNATEKKHLEDYLFNLLIISVMIILPVTSVLLLLKATDII